MNVMCVVCVIVVYLMLSRSSLVKLVFNTVDFYDFKCKATVNHTNKVIYFVNKPFACTK